MNDLRPFIHDRKQKDGVANGTIYRALEVVRHVLNMACDDWGWIVRVPKIRMLKEPKRRLRFTYKGKRMEAIGSAWKRSLKRAGIEKFRFRDANKTKGLPMWVSPCTKWRAWRDGRSVRSYALDLE